MDNLKKIERIANLRDRLSVQPQFLGSADQQSVAEDLGRVLTRLWEEHGISMASVLERAGKATKGDSTKHLSQYIIRPGGTKSPHLRKKAAPYEAVAKAAAKMAGSDEDDMLLDVFGRANFWQSVSTKPASPEFDELAERLRYVMDGIARALDLSSFFDEVEKGGGLLVVSPDCVRREFAGTEPIPPQDVGVELWFDGEQSQLWPISFYEPVREAEDLDGASIPLYPSVILGKWTFSDLGFAHEPVTDATSNPLALDLSLCIIPYARNLQATPALRIVVSGEMPNSLCIPPGLEGYFQRLSISGLEAGTRIIRTMFLPIRGHVCQDWFQLPATKSVHTPLQLRLAEREQGHALANIATYRDGPSLEFRAGSLASVIYRCLCDPDVGLDERLKDRALLRCDAYSRACVQEHRRNEGGWAQINARWASQSEQPSRNPDGSGRAG